MEKQSRIYGIDPGCIDKEKVATYSEPMLYFLIDEISKSIFNAIHLRTGGLRLSCISRPELTELKYALQYCMYQTTRFGVEMPEPKAGQLIQTTGSYNAWFNCWDNYFRSELTKEQLEEFKSKAQSGDDISMFKPSKNWKDNIAKENEAIEREKQIAKRLSSKK